MIKIKISSSCGSTLTCTTEDFNARKIRSEIAIWMNKVYPKEITYSVDVSIQSDVFNLEESEYNNFLSSTEKFIEDLKKIFKNLA